MNWHTDKLCKSQFLGYNLRLSGGVPEWLKGADCKSVGLRLRWFESSLLHQFVNAKYKASQNAGWLCGSGLRAADAGVVQW